MIILYIALIISAITTCIYAPTFLYGYTYNELNEIKNNQNMEKFTEFLTNLNLTEESSKETASRYITSSIFFSIMIVSIIISIILVLIKINNNQNFFKNRKNSYHYSINYISTDYTETQTIINFQITNKTSVYKSFSKENFAIKNNNESLPCNGFIINNKIKENIYINKYSTEIIKVRFPINKENFAQYEIYFNGIKTISGQPIKFRNNEEVNEIW